MPTLIRDAVLPLRDSEAIPDPEGSLGIGFAELMRYHGGANPGGVAHAVAALHVALPLLGESPLIDRRTVRVQTSFGGPGARDVFEMALRAVTGERYVVDASLAEPERGGTLARYVFRFLHDNGTAVTVHLEDKGYVVQEFLDLAALPSPTPEQAARTNVLKLEMTERIVSRVVGEVYEVVGERTGR